MKYPIEEFDEKLFHLTDAQLDGAEKLLMEYRDELLEKKKFGSEDERSNHWIETRRVFNELSKFRKERFRRMVIQYEREYPEE